MVPVNDADPAPPAAEPDRPHFSPWLAYGWKRARERPELGVVPVVASLLDVSAITAVLAWDGFHTGIQFRFPTAVVDLWTMTNTNFGSGVTVDAGVHPVAVLVLALIEGLLAAGYLGSIDALLDGDRVSFLEGVAAYGPALVAYNVLFVAATSALLLGLASISPVLAFFVGAPVLFVGMYLLYATPFLVVVRDCSLAEAVGTSVDYATDGGAYFRYGAGFFAGVAGLSVVVTTVVVNLGVVGIGVGLAVAATLGLSASVATVGFVRRLDAGGFAQNPENGGPA